MPVFLYERHDQKIAELKKKKMASALLTVCRAILPQISLLLLDEPTNHLDIEGKEELAHCLIILKEGCCYTP
ncbi:hypothetical protein O9992_17495 [Vibrio lentus]|nr:hypothetical protein [Vibrio lentus]